jgi:hypothetical protein
MNKKAHHVFTFTALLLVIWFPSHSYGATTFEYVGKPFTRINAGSGNVSMSVGFNEPLVALSVLDERDIAWFSITALGRTITDSDLPTFLIAEFTIGEDLLPTSWGFAVEKNVEGLADPEQWSSFAPPFSFDAFGSFYDAFSIDDSRRKSEAASGNPFSARFEDPGSWTIFTPGDANGDGTVNGLDYLVWAANFGDDPADDPPGSPGNGDFDNNGVVNGLDYLVWAANFEPAEAATAVPEPTSLTTALLAVLGVLTLPRRSR